jgi:predicted transcriptional regulator
MFENMNLKTVTFRVPQAKVAALDSAARHQQRDRSFILNEAVDQYLSLQEYHLALIDEGIRADDAGEVFPHSEVVKMIESMSREKRARQKKSA